MSQYRTRLVLSQVRRDHGQTAQFYGNLGFMRSINRNYVGFGIALGVVFGAAMGRVGLGLALGVVFGMALSAALARKNSLDSN